MSSPELPDAFFDFSLFQMHLPKSLEGINVKGFRLSDLPSVRLQQQVAHECFHVMQSLQYQFFGNFANYLWKRSEAIFDELIGGDGRVFFLSGEGLRRFSERNGPAGQRIWSSIIIQDRYDEPQFREYREQKPASLFSLVESMAVSYQAVASSTLPQSIFPQLPASYTRSHDFIRSHYQKDFDLLDHYVFLAAVDPILRATDFGDATRLEKLSKLARSWSTLRDIFEHLTRHATATRIDYVDFILDTCDDYSLARWDITKVQRLLRGLSRVELSIAAGAMGVASFVNDELLRGANSVPNRVRFTPLSETVANKLMGGGWGEVLDFNIPLSLSSKSVRDQQFSAILAATFNASSRELDIARVGDFALRTIEKSPDFQTGDHFLNCLDHGAETWEAALECCSSQGVSASLERLNLPPAREVFIGE